MMPSERPTVTAFRRLHDTGCFVMPNPWDVGSAVFLHRLGFKALASTSAGLAFSRGVPDHTGSLDVSEVLAHLTALAAATPLPLNADFQAGYARDPDGVAAHPNEPPGRVPPQALAPAPVARVQH
jgi:2-methylisocitrate lyase-like PEP mutase family enzyme